MHKTRSERTHGNIQCFFSFFRPRDFIRSMNKIAHRALAPSPPNPPEKCACECAYFICDSDSLLSSEEEFYFVAPRLPLKQKQKDKRWVRCVFVYTCSRPTTICMGWLSNTTVLMVVVAGAWSLSVTSCCWRCPLFCCDPIESISLIRFAFSRTNSCVCVYVCSKILQFFFSRRNFFSLDFFSLFVEIKWMMSFSCRRAISGKQYIFHLPATSSSIAFLFSSLLLPISH